MPVLDEAAQIADAIASLRSQAAQVVVVDAGSRDATVALALQAGAQVVRSPRGRALQMNAGVESLRPGWAVVLFLHADTRLPAHWADALGAALRQGAQWGRFDVRLVSRHPMLRVVGAMMNLRSRLTGICTGDQAIFVSLGAWRACGGYAPIPLMEDIDLSRRLKRLAPPAALRPPVQASGRRWDRHGVWRTIVTMWSLRLRYFLGESPDRLHRRYYGGPEP